MKETIIILLWVLCFASYILQFIEKDETKRGHYSTQAIIVLCTILILELK